MENSIRLLKKLNTILSYNPAIPLLGIFKRTENNISKGICTPTLTATLFKIAKRKKPECSSTDEK